MAIKTEIGTQVNIYHRIKVCDPVVQIAENKQMMKVVRRIAEAEILGAERNAFQYVTDVVISSEKIHTNANTNTIRQMDRHQYDSTDCIFQKLCAVKARTNRDIFSCPDVKWQQMKQKLVPLNMNETAAAPLLPSNHTKHLC